MKITNAEKIREALAPIERGCTARIIGDKYAESVVAEMTTEVEKSLAQILPKKSWAGLRFRLDLHAQKFPNSYKYIPMSTQMTIERGTKNWCITEIARARCGTREITALNLDERKAEIAEFAISNFGK